jgi:tetratricopeptide (TPR) repeat protein
MDFNELINDGWARHDSQTEAVLAALEAHAALADAPEKAVPFIMLATHTAGAHAGDWKRGAALAERVIAPLEESAALAPALGNLAVAQFMAGDAVAALASEARSVRLTDAEPVSMMVRTRVLTASALVDAKRLEEGAKLYTAAVALARSRGEKLACDRAIAVTSNNLASEFLGKENRTEPESALMLEAAQNAREFWLKCGTWENEERAEYLLASVHNALGQPEKALEHSARGLDVIHKNGEEVVDEAFLNLTIANSTRLLENREAYDRAIRRADELAEQWTDAGLKEWYAKDRAKVEWA